MSREVTGPFPPTPPSLPPSLLLLSSLLFLWFLALQACTFHASHSLTRLSPLLLFIGRSSFGNILFSFEFKPGGSLHHCGSLRFAESAEASAEELERHSDVLTQTREEKRQECVRIRK